MLGPSLNNIPRILDRNCCDGVRHLTKEQTTRRYPICPLHYAFRAWAAFTSAIYVLAVPDIIRIPLRVVDRQPSHIPPLVDCRQLTIWMLANMIPTPYLL